MNTKPKQNSVSEKNTSDSNQNQTKEPIKLREWNLSCKFYLGSLGDKADKYKIEKIFKRYGNLKNIWVAKNPPGFAFIEYEDPSTTESAFKDIYGIKIFDKSKIPKNSKYWQNQSSNFHGANTNNHMKNKQSTNIKIPVEDRPGDWLCPKEECNNVNFSWRENCNKCNTRNPSIKETKEERAKRIYGKNAKSNYSDRGKNNEIAVRISSRGRNSHKESHMKYRQAPNTSRFSQSFDNPCSPIKRPPGVKSNGYQFKPNSTKQFRKPHTYTQNKPINKPPPYTQSKPINKPPPYTQSKPINKPPPYALSKHVNRPPPFTQRKSFDRPPPPFNHPKIYHKGPSDFNQGKPFSRPPPNYSQVKPSNQFSSENMQSFRETFARPPPSINAMQPHRQNPKNQLISVKREPQYNRNLRYPQNKNDNQNQHSCQTNDYPPVLGTNNAAQSRSDTSTTYDRSIKREYEYPKNSVMVSNNREVKHGQIPVLGQNCKNEFKFHPNHYQ